MKAPFTYYGGKQRIGKQIAALLPPHTVYAEPFAGGAAVFWAKPLPAVTNKDHYREVLNDTNGAVVEVFRALRDAGDEVKRRMELFPYSDREYRRARDVYQGRIVIEDPIERAVLFLFFWSASYSGKATGSMKRAVSSENPAATWAAKPNTIETLVERLKGVYIEDIDALACLQRWDRPHTAFYVDPPYMDANQGHYGGWEAADQQELLEALDGIEGSFLLSGYANEMTDQWGVDHNWERHVIPSTVSASIDKRPKKEEVVWKRGVAGTPTEKVKKVLQSSAITSAFSVEES